MPKISGILNNCSLDCAIPSIKQIVSGLAEAERAGMLSDYSNHPAYSNFVLLKDLFADYYTIGRGYLDWQNFDIIISAEPNFLQQQLTFAPVFRNFVAEQMRLANQLEENIGLLSTLRSNGRYYSLASDEAADYFYKPLGIQASFVYPQELKASETFRLPYEPLSQVTLFYKNSHFELLKTNHGVANPNVAKLTGKFKTAYEHFTSQSSTMYHLSKIKSDMIIEIAKRLSSAESSASSSQYDRVSLTNQQNGFFNNKVDTVPRNAISSTKVREGETDLEYAMRLQQAEIMQVLVYN